MNIIKVKEIDELKEIINTACNEMIYHPFVDYQNCGWKILNAANTIYHNILRFYRNQPPSNIAQLNNLSLTQNLALLKTISDILLSGNTPSHKETLIANELNMLNILPDEVLIPYNLNNFNFKTL